ncbi:hypothetical protein M9H77_22406 [Catharanthus roseus]|uniref:Uncharacterized protein n=1 Tax=Catharanthus roseus TaxID=4058 RepID=A0ACC0AUF8_CATRO|nr:hypothetical protein M9H77_22406 [Catharanthus roseus]
MDARFLLFLLVLGTSSCCNARLDTTSLSPTKNGKISSEELQMNEQQQQAVEMMKVEGLCTLCEEVIAPILDYLSNSTNQTELTAALHMLCSFTFIFKDECDKKVDYYVPLIFNMSSSVTPQIFCTEIGLCEIVDFMSQNSPKNSCPFCHHAFKHLNDFELLLKACNAVEGSTNYVEMY